MGIERKPDFAVNSKGEATPERANHLVSQLHLADLFNFAGRAGDRDSEAFIDALAHEFKEIHFEDDSSLENEAYHDPFQQALIKAGEKEGVSAEVLLRALRRAFP